MTFSFPKSISNCVGTLITTITGNITSDVFIIQLYPKTFSALLMHGTGGDVQIQVSPDGINGWTNLLSSPLSISSVTPCDYIQTSDTMIYFRAITSNFSPTDITNIYVSGCL